MAHGPLTHPNPVPRHRSGRRRRSLLHRWLAAHGPVAVEAVAVEAVAAEAVAAEAVAVGVAAGGFAAGGFAAPECSCRRERPVPRRHEAL